MCIANELSNKLPSRAKTTDISQWRPRFGSCISIFPNWNYRNYIMHSGTIQCVICWMADFICVQQSWEQAAGADTGFGAEGENFEKPVSVCGNDVFKESSAGFACSPPPKSAMKWLLSDCTIKRFGNAKLADNWTFSATCRRLEIVMLLPKCITQKVPKELI